MKQIIFLIFNINIFLYANTVVTEVQYEGVISLYGKVGKAKIVLEENKDNSTYKISAVLSTTGLVNKLSSNRQDIYTSEGLIKDGVYLPNIATKQVSKNNSKQIITYKFDRDNKEVVKNRNGEKLVEKKEFDIRTMKFKTVAETVRENSEKKIEYSANDILSLFLNLRKGNLQNGDIEYIDKKEKDSVNVVSDNLVKIEKKAGKEVYNLDFKGNNKSIFSEIILARDIAFYGDAYLKKTYENTRVFN